ncbi:hypothetical protein L950_0228905 [Sphingobacterium sp. IITKGP-BTPF85]|jgi:hypothetical protein|nr:hypothetical protein L950_0228905 [Sphingobacterium sp. IITKGP-BTPF85]
MHHYTTHHIVTYAKNALNNSKIAIFSINTFNTFTESQTEEQHHESLEIERIYVLQDYRISFPVTKTAIGSGSS